MAITYSSLFESVSTQGATAGVPTSSTNYNYAGPTPTKKGEVITVRGTAVVTANLATNDKVRFFQVPKGVRLASWNAEWMDLDGSTTLVADLGWETSDPNAFISAGTGFQAADSTAAGNSLTEDATELVFDNTATTTQDDYLTLLATTGATSLPAAATITFKASFYVV